MKTKTKIIICLLVIIITVFFAREQHFKHKIIREVDGICFVYSGLPSQNAVQNLRNANLKIKKYSSKMFTINKIDAEGLIDEIEFECRELEINIQLLDVSLSKDQEAILLESRVGANSRKEYIRFFCKYMFFSWKRLYR